MPKQPAGGMAVIDPPGVETLPAETPVATVEPATAVEEPPVMTNVATNPVAAHSGQNRLALILLLIGFAVALLGSGGRSVRDVMLSLGF